MTRQMSAPCAGSGPDQRLLPVNLEQRLCPGRPTETTDRPLHVLHGMLVPRTGRSPATDKHVRHFPLSGVGHVPVPHPSCLAL